MLQSALPRVSVVIPVFNKERYLRRAMDSVLGQTFGDFELIVVDDGSTDSSLVVAQSYDDARVIVIHQHNAGAGAARNRGISAARAGLVAFLDGDDAWAPSFLERMIGLVDQFPGAGLYCAPYQFVEPGGGWVKPSWIGVPSSGGLPSYFRSVALGDQVATASSVCVPREVLGQLGGFSRERLGEDQDMWARIALHHPVVAMNSEALAYYYRDAQGRVMHTGLADDELPYSKRLHRALLAGDVPESKRSDVMLYIEAGLLALVSLNARAGRFGVARRFLSDPRLRNFRLRRAFWRLVCNLEPIGGSLIWASDRGRSVLRMMSASRG